MRKKEIGVCVVLLIVDFGSHYYECEERSFGIYDYSGAKAPYLCLPP